MTTERDIRNQMAFAREQGVIAGMEKGMEKGREEERITTAMKMKEDGMSADLIVKYSGLTAEQVEEL